MRPNGRAPSPLIGTTISDRYRVERLLGEGGMGAVYQVEHVLMRKRMAIKVLHSEMTRLPEVVARFEREAMAAAHIDHANVVTATDFGKLDDGSFFLALEFVEGKSLRDSVAKGRLELGRALHIARQIASALGRAHQLKIVHRDLKPENVMLVERDGDPDFVKVLDFGIAKVQIGELTAGDVKGTDPGQPVLTQAGMVYGTPEYMAPEQALGQQVDARADLYALGCMMYEMLCGVRPFEAESKVALLGMQVTAPVPPMASKSPEANVPPEVESIVKHLLAKEANERLGDARELIDILSVAMGQLVAAGRIDPVYAPPPASRLASNPGMSSALLIAAPQASSPKLPSLLAKPGELLANKSWLVVAGGGIIGILALVIVIVVAKGKAKTEDHGGTVIVTADGGVVTLPLDQKVTAAITQIDKGNYGSGIEALEGLGGEIQGREDVHRALFKAYGQTQRPREAMHEVGLIAKANPNIDWNAPDNIPIRIEVRNTALLEGQPTANKAAVEEAWTVLENTVGTRGWDDIDSIAYSDVGANYPNASARAKKSLGKVDHAKVSPALGVNLDIRAAWQNCGGLKGLLDRAVEKGDDRTLFLLKALAPARMSAGHWRKTDLLGCIHEGSLNKAIADLDARVKKK